MEKLSLKGGSKQPAHQQLKGISALLIDGDEIFIDNDAVHAKSRVERGITWVRSNDQVEEPRRRVLGLWITLKRNPEGQGFHGCTSFEMYINQEAKTGYKNLAHHVNQMDRAVKGTVDLQLLGDEERKKALYYLRSVREDLWNHATPSFKEGFVDNPKIDQEDES